MRYKINVPKRLYHETVGLMADLHLKPRGSPSRDAVFIEIDEGTETYLIVFSRLLGPAGLTFEPAEEPPAPIPKAATRPKHKKKR